MDKEKLDIEMGEAPYLLFVPDSIPVDGALPADNIVVIAELKMYLYVRDLVIADQTARRMEAQNEAAQKFYDELMKYKPSEEDDEGNPDETGPALFNFNIEEWLKGDGGMVSG